MKKLTYFVAAAAAFTIFPVWTRFGTIAGAVMLVTVAVLLALAASESASAIAAAAGALGAFAGGVLMAVHPALAGAVLLGLIFAERTLRVDEGLPRILHLGLSLAAGAGAATLAVGWAGAPLMIRAVVVIVAAVLSALPLLVEADDPLAFALDDIARRVAEPASTALHNGAALRRDADEALLDRTTVKHVRKTWQNLLRLAQSRARLERNEKTRKRMREGVVELNARSRAVIRKVDERIAEHVAVLTRTFSAADDAQAAEASIDDDALRTVDATGESLEELSQALVEEV